MSREPFKKKHKQSPGAAKEIEEWKQEEGDWPFHVSILCW